MIDLDIAQSFMRKANIDAWLVYDFRGSNPVMWQAIGEKKSTTRRSFLIIPRQGKPKLLLNLLDKLLFSNIPYELDIYISWDQMQHKLKDLLEGYNLIAMEYSPGAAIPVMSWVDGGTLDLVRSIGKEICSSANIFQVSVASWSMSAFESHSKAVKDVVDIKDEAFAYITQAIRTGKAITEYDVQELIMQLFQSKNMETEDRPIVSVNENSGDPHYEASAEIHSPIKVGDWVLMDLWARYPGDQNVFADITWVGYVGKEVPTKYVDIFNVVKNARDAVINHLNLAWKSGETQQGWQLDMVARNIIENAGYGKYFVHRTGHSIGPGSTLHGLGVNLDNFETHDIRNALPGIGFSVEPGIYLDDFGVRLEINVFLDSQKGPIVTTPLQEKIVELA